MKRYTKNGEIKTRRQIVIRKDGMATYNPTEEMILADGWEEYVPPTYEPIPYKKSPREIMEEIVLEQYNARTDIGNEEALQRAIVIYDWDRYIGKTLKAGQLVSFLNKVYRARQEHIVQEHYEPSLDTASLYEVIEIVPTGTEGDPIPYTPPMEIFEGKYYSQNDLVYRCIRNSEVVLVHDLGALVGLYVEVV